MLSENYDLCAGAPGSILCDQLLKQGIIYKTILLRAEDSVVTLCN